MNEETMSESHKDISKAEIEQTQRLRFASLSLAFKANIEIILDDLYPILRRIQAIGDAEFAIHCACVSEVFPQNGIKSEVFPDIGDYFKALVTVAKEPMSEEHVSTVFRHIHAALTGELTLNLDDASMDTYDAASAPSLAEICSTAIKALIEFRNKSAIFRNCAMILTEIFCRDTFLKERRKCGDIAVASGLIPTLSNMITSHSEDRALEDTASSEELCVSALNVLEELLMFNWSQLPDSILVETAPPVFHCLLNSKSQSILLIGIRVISKFLLSTGKKTIALKFKNGKTGVQYVLLVIEHFLNTMKTQGRVDKLNCAVLEVIRQLTTLNLHYENLKVLSKIMLNLLDDYKTENTALLVIFADLMYVDCEVVFDCLSEPAGSTSGRNYMREVIEGGFCKRYESFEQRDRPTVNLALLQIYHHGVEVKPSDSKLPEEIFEAVRACLLSLDIGNVGEKI